MPRSPNPLTAPSDDALRFFEGPYEWIYTREEPVKVEAAATYRPPGPLDKLSEALAKAQAVIKPPKRNCAVEVKTKSGGSYKFKYATLDAIIEAIRGPFTSNGLWFTQELEPGDGTRWFLRTTLLHASGQTRTSLWPLVVPSGATNQEFGSALTFMKRYSLSSVAGVAADDDDDANLADGNQVQARTEAGPKAKPAARTDAFAAARAAFLKADSISKLLEYHELAKKRDFAPEERSMLANAAATRMEEFAANATDVQALTNMADPIGRLGLTDGQQEALGTFIGRRIEEMLG